MRFMWNSVEIVFSQIQCMKNTAILQKLYRMLPQNTRRYIGFPIGPGCGGVDNGPGEDSDPNGGNGANQWRCW
jgi:hypothetical protein